MRPQAGWVHGRHGQGGPDATTAHLRGTVRYPQSPSAIRARHRSTRQPHANDTGGMHERKMGVTSRPRPKVVDSRSLSRRPPIDRQISAIHDPSLDRHGAQPPRSQRFPSRPRFPCQIVPPPHSDRLTPIASLRSPHSDRLIPIASFRRRTPSHQRSSRQRWYPGRPEAPLVGSQFCEGCVSCQACRVSCGARAE